MVDRDPVKEREFCNGVVKEVACWMHNIANAMVRVDVIFILEFGTNQCGMMIVQNYLFATCIEELDITKAVTLFCFDCCRWIFFLKKHITIRLPIQLGLIRKERGEERAESFRGQPKLRK